MLYFLRMNGVKRARNSSELGPQKHDDRKKEVSQNANWWLVSRVEVKEKAPDEIQNDSKRKKTKVCTFVSISSGHYLSNTLPCIYR